MTLKELMNEITACGMQMHRYSDVLKRSGRSKDQVAARVSVEGQSFSCETEVRRISSWTSFVRSAKGAKWDLSIEVPNGS